MQLLIVITVGKAFLKNNALKGEGIPIYQKRLAYAGGRRKDF